MYDFGGFPEPFLKRKKRFLVKWSHLRTQQLFQEDIRSIAHIQEIAKMEVLAEIISSQIGQLLNRSSLSKKVKVTLPTISRWIHTLEKFYYCFTIQPWFKNVSRSLIKEPKIYLWDWSYIYDPGMRFENFVASHLIKSVDLWSDMGFGRFRLYFLRNKDKKEVDFLVTREDKPWFLVETKNSNNRALSKSLNYFYNEIQAHFGFQVSKSEDYENISSFKKEGIWIVSSKTFLSQLA